jgi:Tfp pilus assembly protein PilF
MALSVEAMNARDLATARRHLDVLIAIEPNYAEGWNKRATVFFMEGDFAASLADIRRTLEIEPRHFGALSGLGMILERMDQKAGALKAFRDALAIHPQMPAVRSRVEALSAEVEGTEL